MSNETDNADKDGKAESGLVDAKSEENAEDIPPSSQDDTDATLVDTLEELPPFPTLACQSIIATPDGNPLSNLSRFYLRKQGTRNTVMLDRSRPSTLTQIGHLSRVKSIK